jgi:MFS superfamily sulfate permease-like transporter
MDATFLLGAALAAGAFLGGILLIVAEFSTLYEVKAGAGNPAAVVRSTSGHDQHSYALVLLGLGALVMAYGATRRGSRPAMAALIAVGVVTLCIALIGDLPDATSTGVVGRNFEDARAVRGAGFYLETLGSFLLIIAGSAGLFLSSPGRRPTRERRPRPDAAGPPPA